MWKDRKEDHVVYQVRDADTLKRGLAEQREGGFRKVLGGKNHQDLVCFEFRV